jgi:glycine cleavage system transcriptional repressor
LEYGAGTLKKYYLLTAFGKDRPGIVADVTGVLVFVGGNIEDATMTRLGGEFSMMLVTALPAGKSLLQVQKSFRALEKKLGLTIALKSIPPALAHHSKEKPAGYMISVYGADHPGIVHSIARALASHQVSITDLQTKVTGPFHKPVYVMLLEVQFPDSLDMDELRTELDRLRQDLKVEISMQDIEAIPL